MTPNGTNRSKRPVHWPPPVYDHPLPQLLHDIGAGLRPPPTSEARRHHFVPQFVLRGFLSQSRPGYLVSIDRQGHSNWASARSVAFEKGLYGTKDDDGQWDNRLEAFLATVESYARPALDRLLDQTAPATEDEGLPLSMLMALQMLRTPGTLDRIGTAAEQLGNAWLQGMVNDPTVYANHVRRFGIGDISARELEDRRRDAAEAVNDGARLRLAGKRAFGVEFMTRALLDVGLAIAEADWWILHAAKGSSFVTNDCGLARITREHRLPLERGIAFPVRSDACIFVAPSTDRRHTL